MTVQILHLRSVEFFMELILEKAALLETGLIDSQKVRKEIRVSGRPFILTEESNWEAAVRRLLSSRQLWRTSMKGIYRLAKAKYVQPKTRNRRKKGWINNRRKRRFRRSDWVKPH